jgi:hypothetical protein
MVMFGILAVLWSSSPSASVKPWGVLETSAMANPMVSSVGGVTMLTTDAGTDEVLIVLDNRTEMLMVYRVNNVSAVELLQRQPVGVMFNDARIKSLGK